MLSALIIVLLIWKKNQKPNRLSSYDCTITVSINVCMVHFHLKTFNFNPNQQFMDLITQLTSNSYLYATMPATTEAYIYK